MNQNEEFYVQKLYEAMQERKALEDYARRWQMVAAALMQGKERIVVSKAKLEKLGGNKVVNASIDEDGSLIVTLETVEEPVVEAE